MTLAQIDRLLDRARRDAAKAEADLALLRAQVIQLEAMRDEAKRRLHSASGSSKLRGNMSTTTSSDRRMKIAAAKTVHGGAAKTLLIAAGKSDGDIAAELGVGRSTVRAWHAGERQIPRRYAEAIEKAYGVPLAAWSKILD